MIGSKDCSPHYRYCLSPDIDAIAAHPQTRQVLPVTVADELANPRAVTLVLALLCEQAILLFLEPLDETIDADGIDHLEWPLNPVVTELHRIIDGDWRGGFAFFNNPALFEEFAKKNTMTITGPSNKPVSYSLKGTSQALKALDECRKEKQG